jgi:hypothetical protein
MGTNYYGRQIQKLKLLDDLEQKIFAELRSLSKNTSTELDDVISEYFQMKRSEIDEIHIGKQSAGWSFCFNHHDWKYFKDRKSLIQWLDTLEIISEYGEVKTTEDFIKSVDDRNKNNTDRSLSTNIVKDGLQFSMSTEFS